MTTDENPWAKGHSLEILREVAAGITANVSDYTMTAVNADGVNAEWIVANGVPSTAPITLYFHGGAYLCGHPAQYRNMTVWLSRVAQVRVLSVDYRLAPEHPFPAACEDALTVYQWLLVHCHADPQQLIVAGDSAGAGLAVTVVADACAAGLPQPACIIGNSPYVDLQLQSPSLDDPLRNQQEPNKITIQWLAQTFLEAGGLSLDADNPRHSPVYRDLTGLPPLLIQTGELDNLQDDGVRLAERAEACGVNVRHTAYAGAPHIWPVLFPADQSDSAADAITEMANFIRENLA